MFQLAAQPERGSAASAASAGSAVVVPEPWEWAARHPLAARLEGWVPGPDLAAELAGVDVPDADDAALVEMVDAWERMSAWVAAGQARVIGEMATRAGSRLDFVGDEVAATLRVSRRAGENKLDFALGLGRLPKIADALAAGAIDVRKADALVRETEHLEPVDAVDVVGAVLDRAGDLTVPQLRIALRRAELARNPLAAAARHDQARAERTVRMVPAPDSMAWIHAFLPADGAMRVVTGLDAVAAACAAGDPRGIDARRADALVDLVGAVLDSGVGPGGVPIPVQQRRRPHLQVMVAASTLDGADDAPAELLGYGPITADMARRIAAEATWRGIAVDPVTGQRLPVTCAAYRPSAELVAAVVDRDVTCRFPGCRAPATRCDIDHIEPFDRSRPAAGQTRSDNLHVLCRHHHRMKTFGGWRPVRDDRGVTTWVSRTGQVHTRDPEPIPPEEGIPRRLPPPTTDADPPWRAVGGAA